MQSLTPLNHKIKIIFSDFDATATEEPGAGLINTLYYNNLFDEPPGGLKEGETLYEVGVFKKDAMEIIQDRVGGGLDPRRVTSAAVDFTNMATEQENTFFFILSKNRKDYIKYMYLLEKILLNKIGVCSVIDGFCGYDSNPEIAQELQKNVTFTSKGHMVEVILDTLIAIASKNKSKEEIKEELGNWELYFFDDNEDDLMDMCSPIIKDKYQDYEFYKRYRSYNEKLGNFKWDKYALEIFPHLAEEKADIKIEEKADTASVSESGIYSRPNSPTASPQYSDEENDENIKYSDDENILSVSKLGIYSQPNPPTASPKSSDEENTPLKYFRHCIIL